MRCKGTVTPYFVLQDKYSAFTYVFLLIFLGILQECLAGEKESSVPHRRNGTMSVSLAKDSQNTSTTSAQLPIRLTFISATQTPITNVIFTVHSTGINPHLAINQAHHRTLSSNSYRQNASFSIDQNTPNTPLFIRPTFISTTQSFTTTDITSTVRYFNTSTRQIKLLSSHPYTRNVSLVKDQNTSTTKNAPTFIIRSTFISTPQITTTNINSRTVHHSNSYFPNTRTRQTNSSYTSVYIQNVTSSRPGNMKRITPSVTTDNNLASSVTVVRGSKKTFIAEIRIVNLNFSSALRNKSSSLFRRTASDVTNAVDVIMAPEPRYTKSQVISFREGSVITNFEIEMTAGFSNDPNVVLDRLKSAVESGRFGNLTVDSTYFVGWMKKNPAAREVLISGQLAGVALIVFILVALLLVICLGKFAAEPLYQERDIFIAELPRRRDVGRNNESINEDTEWKFDPLFAWSRETTYDSKL